MVVAREVGSTNGSESVLLCGGVCVVDDGSCNGSNGISTCDISAGYGGSDGGGFSCAGSIACVAVGDTEGGLTTLATDGSAVLPFSEGINFILDSSSDISTSIGVPWSQMIG